MRRLKLFGKTFLNKKVVFKRKKNSFQKIEVDILEKKTLFLIKEGLHLFS